MSRNLAELLDTILALAQEASSFLVRLEPLTLSIDEAVEGAPTVINILGSTAGGRIVGTPPDGMTLDPATPTISGIPTTVGEYDITLRETHPQGSNSPRLSVVRFTVAARPVTPNGPWSFDSTFITIDRTDVTFDGAAGGSTQPQPRLFFTDPFFADPFFRTGA